MTTIAWDGKTLAADRCRVSGRGMKQPIQKLRVCGRFVFGGTGDLADLEAVARWLRAGARWRDRPKVDGDQSGGLVVDSKTLKLYLLQGDPATLCELPIGPASVGSGSPYAAAAMACGKDACAAVVVAAKFDDGTDFGWDAWPQGTCRVEIPAMPALPALPAFPIEGLFAGKRESTPARRRK